MTLRVTVCDGMSITLEGCSSSSGVYRWVPFVGKGKKDKTNTALAKPKKSDPFGPVAAPVYYGGEMRLRSVPEFVQLSETRTLGAHLVLINRSRKHVNFIFNDSREYGFILRDATG